MSLTVTSADLRTVLDSRSEKPVLYVDRDEDTNKPVHLEVWDEAYVNHGDIVVRQHELRDVVGEADGEDALTHLLPEYQATVDELLAAEADQFTG